MDSKLIPFAKAHQLNDELDSPTKENESASLPGQPCVSLDDPVCLADLLTQEFCAPDLEKMAPHLWMMSTQSSANISSLHHQKVKGREIVVTENPRLHLVWGNNRILIKPLPKYLLSYVFWKSYLLNDTFPLGDGGSSIRKAALGYLRTYFYLIRHESDFYIAQNDQLRLVPQHITWPQFCRFTSNLRSIDDSDVSSRYAYGELRLSRLNFFAKFILRKSYFLRIHHQYGAFFSRFYGPLLFIFGIVSLILSAMQVVVAVEQVTLRPWPAFSDVSRWFSVTALLGIMTICLSLVILFVVMVANEWIFAIRALLKKRRKAGGDIHNS